MQNIPIIKMIEAGMHYGHKKNLWNPKMAQYIYGIRNGVHIIDLQQTATLFSHALNVLREVASKNGRILFVGTKTQATDILAEFAQKCGQYYVNHRWLGGMLTNWPTVSASLKTMKEYEELLENENLTLTKKERLDISRKHNNLEKVLGGIKNMGGMPDLLFVIDTNKESLAIKEANKLGIPIVAICDTNTSPDGIDYVIPGNDDARKAILLYCQLASDAILQGMQASMSKSGIDIGASAEINESTFSLNKESDQDESSESEVTE